MNSKEYVMPDGKKAVFEYDHDGIGKVTIEAMDMLMGLIADGRKRGEWLPDEKGDFRCTNCGRIAEWEFFEDNFCPNCGARMKTADNEGAIEQMQHDILYELTYNPEDGSM